jgi:hypothetical protein
MRAWANSDLPFKTDTVHLEHDLCPHGHRNEAKN